MVAETKNIIVGRRTYEIMSQGGELTKLNNPKAVTNLGCNTALVSGGTLLNTSFLNSGLVDELYLDIEPVLIGTGIPLFGTVDFNCKLELDQINQTGKNTVQLRYSFLR